jgi:DNA ligase-1
VDSDDEDDVQVVDYPVLQLKRNDASERIQEKEGDRESDEAMARRLAAEWAEEDGADQAQADTKVEVKAEDDSEVLVVIKSETKPDPASAPKLTRTLHSLFQPPSSAGPSRATQPAPTAIDFDTDSLLFCPEDIDTSLWPAGHVPYAVLVGAYTQVAGTRSRLAIVRVLTK